MQAMILRRIIPDVMEAAPLELADIPVPEPAATEVLVKVAACAVCHTELDEIEGRTLPPALPVIPGHQVVGRVVKMGAMVKSLSIGDRVGVGWIYSACGHCAYCLAGEENLCPQFQATGRDVDGGYAQYMTVAEAFAHRIPGNLTDEQAAPLLCAGAIGYRALRLTGLQNGQRLGLMGFGASAHLVLQLVRAKYPESPVYIFARSEAEQAFARTLGATWAGGISEASPEALHSIIDTTPAWKPVVESLKNLRPGGRLVINAIRKEEADKRALLELSYAEHLWLEREIKSVANVSRKDIRECLQLAGQIPLQPHVQLFRLTEANTALQEVKSGQIRGAKVLTCR